MHIAIEHPEAAGFGVENSHCTWNGYGEFCFAHIFHSLVVMIPVCQMQALSSRITLPTARSWLGGYARLSRSECLYSFVEI